MIPPVTTLISEHGPRATNFIACSEGMWDGAGRETSTEEADRECRATGCMWWSIKDGSARGPGLIEVCGDSRSAETTKPAPIFAFSGCYWVAFETIDGHVRIRAIVGHSIT
jgi:hypothetical protein